MSKSSSPSMFPLSKLDPLLEGYFIGEDCRMFSTKRPNIREVYGAETEHGHIFQKTFSNGHRPAWKIEDLIIQCVNHPEFEAYNIPGCEPEVVAMKLAMRYYEKLSKSSPKSIHTGSNTNALNKAAQEPTSASIVITVNTTPITLIFSDMAKLNEGTPITLYVN
jgi:hypothetical protein